MCFPPPRNPDNQSIGQASKRSDWWKCPKV
jgi:hypothetical protein